MRVVTAPEGLDDLPSPSVFLAGGITGCPDWQQEVIGKLADVKMGCLLNPRRANFPIHDPNAAREQITWEFRALSAANVFSMWFSNAPSDQPICFYELGRHLAMRQVDNQLNYVVLGVEKGFKRSQDVYIQSELVAKKLSDRIVATLDEYVENIREAVYRFASDAAFGPK
jgi:hypothetical protein